MARERESRWTRKPTSVDLFVALTFGALILCVLMVVDGSDYFEDGGWRTYASAVAAPLCLVLGPLLVWHEHRRRRGSD